MQYKPIGLKIKFCVFPLSDRPTKIAATQKILLPCLMKTYFLDIFFISIIHELGEYILNIDQQTSVLVKNIAYESL
jgi:hypothetical protein